MRGDDEVLPSVKSALRTELSRVRTERVPAKGHGLVHRKALLELDYIKVQRGHYITTMRGDMYLNETGRILDELRRRLEVAVDGAAPGEAHEAAVKALSSFDAENPELPGAVHAAASK